MLVLVAAILLLSSNSIGAQNPAPPAPAVSAAAGEKEDAVPSTEQSDALPTERYGETDKVCRQWSDGCRTCTRGADGVVACSNIGIACQPGAVTCASSQNAPAGK